MTAVLVVVHLLAATVWVGGSTALIFVGVPAIRTLDGEPRGRAMKELGLRWRPLGYGALVVAALTGVVSVPVETYDERFTTALASQSGSSNAPEDARAAAHLLTSYLQHSQRTR